MKTYIWLFIGGFSLIPFASNAATTCSRANLTRCLDSACAINISSNPAARCQYCGTSSAGTPPAGGMRSVSAGQSAKYNISDKELKQAPSDAGARYAWATELCIKKVAGCTPDDVSDTYDKLIEQSCTAAGISSEMAVLQKKVNKVKNKATCDAEIRNCVISDKACNADYSKCTDTASFDKYFADCSIQATGCEDFLADLRSDLSASRETTLANAETILTNIVESYQTGREQRLASAKSTCTDDRGRDACIATVCAEYMPHKCGNDNNTEALAYYTEYKILEENRNAIYASEKSMATSLCKFYDIACNLLK